MEVRVQFTRVASLHVGLWDEIQVVSLNRKYLYLLSHLTFLQNFYCCMFDYFDTWFYHVPYAKITIHFIILLFQSFYIYKDSLYAYTIVCFSECYI